jgi:hypothetical protein
MIYGVTVQVTSTTEASKNVLKDLREDFQYFESVEAATEPLIQLVIGHDLNSQQGPTRGRLCPVFWGRRVKVLGWGHHRFCDYRDGHFVESENIKTFRRFWVSGPDPQRLYELSYLALLSAIGEELEARGYIRIHGLSFHGPQGATLAILDSGMGKSSVATLLLRDTRYQIYSDEISLLREGVLFPFPLRRALRAETLAHLHIEPGEARLFQRKGYTSKYLLPIPLERVATPAPLQKVFYGVRPKELLWRAFGVEKLSLCVDVVLGLGLPQMAEHMLRFDTLPRLMRFAIARIRVCYRMHFCHRVIPILFHPDSQEMANSVTEEVGPGSALAQ